MYPRTSPHLIPVEAFAEISKRVGQELCPKQAPGCAIYEKAPSGKVTTDIKVIELKESEYPLRYPGGGTAFPASGVRFNYCQGATDSFRVLVHEAGHALGVRGGREGSGQLQHHPSIKDSLMSYAVKDGYTCSPHPFDVMAIYAFYKNR